MESERIFYSGRDTFLFALSVFLQVAAGYLLSQGLLIFSFMLFVCGLITLFIVIKSFRKINKAAVGFFEAMSNDDTAFRFSEDSNMAVINNLHNSMNRLKDHFQAIRMKSEFNEAYYKSIIQYSSAGLIVLNEHNEIELINKAACSFAGISPELVNTGVLKIKYPDFYAAVCDIRPGENRTFRNIITNTLNILSFRATALTRQEKELKLVSIHDIRYELEARELESYRKIMNVMTHEIMNLLTPLTTVAKELSSIFNNIDDRNDPASIGQETLSSSKKGLSLIGEHGDYLMNFVNNYRKISKLPQPVYGKIDPSEWSEQLKIAFSGPMMANNIGFTISTDRSLKHIPADKKLLNQAVINIINNSMDAVKDIEGQRMVHMSLLSSSGGDVIIRICNNGPEIPQEISDRIFVPFFTTKANGSGIGLSISQEIIKLHKGSITFISKKDDVTCFIISLPLV